MSDLNHIFFYEVTLSDATTNNVLEKLLLKSQQDLAALLKKMGVRKSILEGGYNCSMTFNQNNISYDINRLEPHSLNFNRKAFSQERGDSLFEVFVPDLVLKIKPEFDKFIQFCNDNLEYSDNFRIGVKGCEKSMKEFDDLHSCCGSYFESIYIIGYGEVIFGCNYGH